MENRSVLDKITLESRKNLAISGVDSVDSFTDGILKLTVVGTRLLVSGSNIKIQSFNKETGNLLAVGQFNEIKYQTAKIPFHKRVFK